MQFYAEISQMNEKKLNQVNGIRVHNQMLNLTLNLITKLSYISRVRVKLTFNLRH